MNAYPPHRSKLAFSLVELSIVLVILGLLVGGVLAGQSLIRAAELRAITTEYARYVTAVGSFRDKYFALPGDMTNATAFWNAADGSTGNTVGCVTTAGTSTQTCNGNGDGIVYPSTSSQESYRYWQQLANAGLIEGSFDGITHGSTINSSTTANSPSSKLTNGLWWVWYYSTLSGSSLYFDGTYGTFLMLGKPTANTYPALGILKPEELWNIDTKLDDGKPATGKVVVYANGGLATCTDTGTSSTLTASYLLTSSATVCNPVFRN